MARRPPPKWGEQAKKPKKRRPARKATAKLKGFKLRLEGDEWTPLQFWQDIMHNDKAPMEFRMKAAQIAMPYCHRVLRPVEAEGPQNGKVTIIFDD